MEAENKVLVSAGATEAFVQSDKSGMDGGDLLGDRFWLSPKKGMWQIRRNGYRGKRKQGAVKGGFCPHHVWHMSRQQLIFHTWGV